MRRFFSIFLCVFLLLTLALPAFAGNVVILNYEPWLFFYDLEACDENYNIWLGMYSYGGSEELYPIHVTKLAFMPGQTTPRARTTTSVRCSEPVPAPTEPITPTNTSTTSWTKL